MRILLIDGQALFCSGVALVLTDILPDAMILQAGGAEAALALVENSEVGCGLALIEQEALAAPAAKPLLERLGRIPIIVLSTESDQRAIFAAVHLGARAFLLKSSSREVLKHAIRMVLSGDDYFLCPPLAKFPQALDQVVSQTPAATADIALSDRQRQIMGLLGNGISNKEIARRFNVSEATIKVHLRGLYRKLQVANRTQAAMVAAGRRHPANAA